jgi:hypothetical protein
MAEAQAGQPNAQQQQQVDQNAKPDGEQPAPRQYTQEELDRITAKVRKNARREGRLEAEAEVGRRHIAQPAQPQGAEPRPQEPKADEAPKREAFDNYEEYLEAKARHEGRSAAREEREKAEKETKAKEQREAHEKAKQSWHSKIAAAQAKLPDFETVLEDNEEVLDEIGRTPMRGIITQSDIGPQIIFELCKNPAEVKRIAALPAYKQAAEIAKIEDRLTAAAQKPQGDDEGEPGDGTGDETRERNADGTFKAPPKKEPPKAPPEPIEPGTGRSASGSSKPSDKDTPEEWRRKRVAEIEARRKGK